MADVWNGSILLPDDITVEEIVLASQNVASSLAIPANNLRFLSTVDTARIPLYLAVGPSLDVWTTSESTEQWFESILVSKAASIGDASTSATAQGWWTRARAQSPVGILVQVESEISDVKGPKITEILFYGTVAATPNDSLPTPPSSSPDLAQEQLKHLPQLRVHALPLSSDLLHQPNLPEFPPLSPALSASDPVIERTAQFIPSPFPPTSATTKSPKRKRERDIFEEAEQLRKKANQKGGEGIAAAAARASDGQVPFTHRKSLSIDTKTSPLTDIRPASANAILSRPPSRQLSRSPSISSDSRPLSRKGVPDGHTKRSTLSRVETVSIQPEEPTTQTRNKEALSRVVMAAMRMYGLQQRKRNKSRRSSVAPGVEQAQQLSEEAAAEEAAKDEEYKLIYHQTYKGAALALRKHIATEPLYQQPDQLRDVVEKLLAIFCTDPLAEPLPTQETPDLLTTPGSQKRLGAPRSTHSHTSPFDAPRSCDTRAAEVLKETHSRKSHLGTPTRTTRER